MKVWFSLNIHTELHNLPYNLKILADEVVPKIHDDYGVKPTFFIQVEPPRCNKENLFRQFPDVVEELAKFGEIAIHSHCFHDTSFAHQAFHIGYALKESDHYKPTSWVSGDWLTNKDTIELLEAYDLKVDSSILPPRHTWLNPQLPYYPSKGNIYKIANPSFNVLEVPNTPQLRLGEEIGAALNRSWTTGWLARLNQFVDEVPLVMPCHSYDFLNQPRYWHLLGYLNWLTETYDVKMVTAHDFLNYQSNIKIRHQLRFYRWELKRMIRNVWKPNK